MSWATRGAREAELAGHVGEVDELAALGTIELTKDEQRPGVAPRPTPRAPGTPCPIPLVNPP